MLKLIVVATLIIINPNFAEAGSYCYTESVPEFHEFEPSQPKRPIVPMCMNNVFSKINTCSEFALKLYNKDVNIFNEEVDRYNREIRNYLVSIDLYTNKLKNYIEQTKYKNCN